METLDNTNFIFNTTIDGGVYYIAIIHYGSLFKILDNINIEQDI